MPFVEGYFLTDEEYAKVEKKVQKRRLHIITKVIAETRKCSDSPNEIGKVPSREQLNCNEFESVPLDEKVQKISSKLTSEGDFGKSERTRIRGRGKLAFIQISS